MSTRLFTATSYWDPVAKVDSVKAAGTGSPGGAAAVVVAGDATAVVAVWGATAVVADDGADAGVLVETEGAALGYTQRRVGS